MTDRPNSSPESAPERHDYPKVTVLEIPGLPSSANEGSKVDLGGRHSVEAALVEEKSNALLSAMKKTSQRVFELTWEGDKIPSGAVVAGKTIAWTQNGIVSASDGEMIGTYERLEEFAGTSGKTQRMRIFVLGQKDEAR
jgi:hypothetical protein